MPLRHASPSPPQALDSLHRLAKEHSRRPPNFLFDTLIKTGSESIETALRRRQVLFAGFVARMEDTRLLKCVVFGELVGGAGFVGGQKKEWIGYFLDSLVAFDTNTDQWTTAAQDKGK